MNMVKRHKLIGYLLLLAVCIVSLVVLAASLLLRTSPSNLLLRCVFAGYVLTQRSAPMPSPTEVFRQHILDPLPESVTNMKVDRPKDFMGYRYTLRFDLNRADLSLLVDSLSLKRIWSVRYANGYLHWGWDRPGGLLGISKHSTTMTVYHSKGSRKPEWFGPELWDDPEAYALENESGGDTNTKVLIYNEKEGQAYFIVQSL